ncbi:MAG TPA: tetratricopeptide repeat protein [Rhizomicrobium sp.]|nr:tetratricopeptide repeat protein [Rhizomicrobium sp.]
MRRETSAILFSLITFFSTGNAPATAEGACPTEPRLHHSIEESISECTSVIHGTTRFGRVGQWPEMRAEGYYDRGLLYALTGKYQLAISDYTSAIGWQHDFADAYEARADAFEDLGQHEKAAADYDAATKMGGDDATGANLRCWARAVRGHPLDRALADCNEALKADPGNKDILQSRCFVYFRMGDYQAAIADCDAAEKSHPRFSDALYVGGLSKLRLGDTAGGNADIAAALDADYRIGDLYALYGVKR